MTDDFSKLDLDNPEEFLSELHRLVDDSVLANIEAIEEKYGDESVEAYRNCVTDVVQAFAQANLLQDLGPENAEYSTVLVAYQAIRIAKFFLIAFDTAYKTTATRMSVREQLNKQWNL